MKLKLIKLSFPGWEQDFNNYSELYDELIKYVCKQCEKKAIVNAILNETSCGAEFLVEEEFDE